MIRKLFLFGMFCTVFNITKAQEESTNFGVLPSDIPTHNLVKYNRFYFNPTFSLVRENKKSINVYNKVQWASFNDNPQTFLINYTSNFDERMGVSIGLHQQNEGIYRYFGGVANYAYRVEIDRDMNLTFGMNLGFSQSGIKSNIDAATIDDGFTLNNGLQVNDPLIINYEKSSVFLLSPGINFNYDQFDVGVAVSNLVAYNLTSSELATDNMTISGHAMYTTSLERRSDKTVRAMVYASMPSEGDLRYGANGIVELPKLGWAQLGYNSFYGASLGVGANISPKVSIGYTYETGFGDTSNFGATHEVGLAYNFNVDDRKGRSRKSSSQKAYEARDSEIRRLKKEILQQNKLIQELREKNGDSLSEARRAMSRLERSIQEAKEEEARRAKELAEQRKEEVELLNRRSQLEREMTEQQRAEEERLRSRSRLSVDMTAEERAAEEERLRARRKLTAEMTEQEVAEEEERLRASRKLTAEMTEQEREEEERRLRASRKLTAEMTEIEIAEQKAKEEEENLSEEEKEVIKEIEKEEAAREAIAAKQQAEEDARIEREKEEAEATKKKEEEAKAEAARVAEATKKQEEAAKAAAEEEERLRAQRKLEMEMQEQQLQEEKEEEERLRAKRQLEMEMREQELQEEKAAEEERLRAKRQLEMEMREQELQEEKAAEEERLRQEAEAARLAEEERLRQEAEAARLAEEERLRQEAEAARLAEEERLRQEAEAARLAEEERLRQEAEAARLAEEERLRQEAEAARLAEEERLRQEAEAARLAEEERLRQEAEAARLAEEERLRQEAEAARLAEEERLRQEAEAARLAEEERLRQEAEEKAAEEERLRAQRQLEMEMREQQRLEEEARQKAAEEERLRAQRQLEMEMREQRRLEEEAKQKAEEERLRQEAEAARLAEEERKRQEEKEPENIQDIQKELDNSSRITDKLIASRDSLLTSGLNVDKREFNKLLESLVNMNQDADEVRKERNPISSKRLVAKNRFVKFAETSRPEARIATKYIAGYPEGYYLIGNVFKGGEYAERFKSALQNDLGFNNTQVIVNPENDFQYVAIESYRSKDEAIEKYMSSIDNRYLGDMWILNIARNRVESFKRLLQETRIIKATVKEDNVLTENLSFIGGHNIENGYYLITNIFKRENYFEQGMAKLRSQGLEPQHFRNPKDNYIYVYLKRFDSLDEAKQSLFSNVDNTYDGELYILKVQ